jgi:hypothetical protein
MFLSVSSPVATRAKWLANRALCWCAQSMRLRASLARAAAKRRTAFLRRFGVLVGLLPLARVVQLEDTIFVRDAAEERFYAPSSQCGRLQAASGLPQRMEPRALFGGELPVHQRVSVRGCPKKSQTVSQFTNHKLPHIYGNPKLPHSPIPNSLTIPQKTSQVHPIRLTGPQSLSRFMLKLPHSSPKWLTVGSQAVSQSPKVYHNSISISLTVAPICFSKSLTQTFISY